MIDLTGVRGARPTFPSGKKHVARLAARTTKVVTKYDGMVSNRHSEDLRYEHLVAFTIKASAPLRRGDRKIDNRTNLIVGEVTSGTPPDLTFLQDSTANPRVPPIQPSVTSVPRRPRAN
ncbi:hypothetical protein B296_00039026 [Ensete ventricosum]|uniref:Uncharacterized protein n=1 Tax=Ensete ventricosum TaxID=4639 RepID=A0A426XKY7_ENSVE|nr:hypothetical protein B296_00039026 [Ensete ventricosum]